MQPVIDKAVPVYFEGRGMSTMLGSDKLTVTTNEKDLDFIHPAAVGLDTGLPSISILTDMGLDAATCTVFYHEKDKCLRIHLPGTSSKTYPFLQKLEGLEAEIHNLSRDARQPTAESATEVDLADAFDFGSTAWPRHTHWETRQT